MQAAVVPAAVGLVGKVPPAMASLAWGGGARRNTRRLMVGTVPVGGGAPVSLQSMTNSDTRNVAATMRQIAELAAAGCEIIRVAVPDTRAIAALRTIVARSPIPVIADIHFDYRLALSAIDAGAAGIRVNPGNLGGVAKARAVAKAAAAAGTVVRIGVNGGSLEPALRRQYGGATPAALVASALQACELFEACGCHQLKVSIKSSSVPSTVAACREFAACTDYPLHLGVTEAGSLYAGTIKSAAGIGCLLLEGIGDTLRVSLTARPVEEILAGIRILEAVGLRHAHPEVIACPTCGRTEIDLIGLVSAVEGEIARLKAQGRIIRLDKVAIMGCVVNGPGEAREADVGIAGGRQKGVLFRRGKIVRTLSEAELLPALIAELQAAAADT